MADASHPIWRLRLDAAGQWFDARVLAGGEKLDVEAELHDVAVAPALISQARVSFGPAVRNVCRPSARNPA